MFSTKRTGAESKLDAIANLKQDEAVKKEENHVAKGYRRHR
jgi:hypothetical protein